MQIKNITHAQTGETRTDGRYPLRIGSTVEFYEPPFRGCSMVLAYVLDNQGNPKSGYLQTSVVKNVQESPNQYIITTKNSIYYLER